MIVFDLVCNAEHVFEAWFDDSNSFEVQLKKKLISCPYCNSTKINKSIMSPNISSKSSSSDKLKKKQNKQFSLYNKMINKLKKDITNNFQYVGKEFPDKVRKIHYGEISDKPIYGEATAKESKELLQEGIKLTIIPWIKEDKNKN